jgi:hypothetical protein
MHAEDLSSNPICQRFSLLKKPKQELNFNPRSQAVWVNSPFSQLGTPLFHLLL